MSRVLEMIQCAQINLENLAKLVPGLSSHPFYEIVKMQLGEAEKLAEGEEVGHE